MTPEHAALIEEFRALALALVAAERLKDRAARELHRLWDALDADGSEVDGSDQCEREAVVAAGRAVDKSRAAWDTLYREKFGVYGCTWAVELLKRERERLPG